MAEFNDPNLFFFGNKTHSFESIQKQFSDLQFLQCQQEHGDQLVHADNAPTTADAMWTEKEEVGLLIKTADCLPILISHPNYICAIHAGWRGVLNQITQKSVSYLVKKFKTASAIRVFIGPHIQYNSFEVGVDLLADFQRQVTSPLDNYFYINKDNPKKAFINLSTLVLNQLYTCGVPEENISISKVDTLLDPQFHSYRREHDQSGRNYSFVARRRHRSVIN